MSKILTRFLAVAVLTLVSNTVHAGIITFDAVGSPDVTGYVQFDDTFFLGGTDDSISNSAITGLSLTVFGFNFTLSNVVASDDTIVDSSGVIPLIVNGAGALAFNGVATIAFFPDGFGGSGFDGDASLALDTDGIFDFGGEGWESFTAVAWQAEAVQAVPEPNTLALIGLGLAGLAYSRRKRA